MSALTGVLYAALIAYLGGWFFGYWSGNFALLLFILSSVTFAYWLAERFHFKPQRDAAVAELERQDVARRESQAKQGIQRVDADISAAREELQRQPWWLDWTAGLFPVIIAVFVLRSFLFEPFKIPSGSMIPTLHVGDLILVNKFHYGVRLPVINKKIISNNEPARGDVMVFRFPQDTSKDYIKRVIGLPGDEVSYRNQQLYLNGQAVPASYQGEPWNEDSRRYDKEFLEKLGTMQHRILVEPSRPIGIVPQTNDGKFPFYDNCHYSGEGVTCKVPAGHYFMMGDNRDNSLDSRYWGFVPDENIVGKAFFVWLNFGNLKRSFHSFD